MCSEFSEVIYYVSVGYFLLHFEDENSYAVASECQVKKEDPKIGDSVPIQCGKETYMAIVEAQGVKTEPLSL